ncbi:DUF6113 family protein [Sanguibacter sp. A247]|uniref:DUF6113 family protein n=1 Tax=unclassified Sanguibacter TaxID=2645534 RepID=UPI003FD8387A
MTMQRFLMYVAAIVVGAVLGVLGTFGHRSVAPWGLVLAVLACVAAGIWVRATFTPMAVIAYLVGWTVAVQILAAGGPGGDTQVVADTLGYVWSYGTALLVLGVLGLPRTWFADTEVARTRRDDRAVAASDNGRNVR